jgi:Tfp pilus assembly protein PilO
MEDWQIALIVMVCVILVVLLLMLCFRLRRKNVVYVESYIDQKEQEEQEEREEREEFNRKVQDQINETRNKLYTAKNTSEYEEYKEQLWRLKGMRDANFTTH